MKILLIADEEDKYLWDYYRRGSLDGVDLILSAGDLTLSGKMELMPKHPEVLYEAGGYIYNAKMLKKMEFSRDGRYLLASGVYEDTATAVVRVFEIDWIYEGADCDD